MLFHRRGHKAARACPKVVGKDNHDHIRRVNLNVLRHTEFVQRSARRARWCRGRTLAARALHLHTSQKRRTPSASIFEVSLASLYLSNIA